LKALHLEEIINLTEPFHAVHCVAHAKPPNIGRRTVRRGRAGTGPGSAQAHAIGALVVLGALVPVIARVRIGLEPATGNRVATVVGAVIEILAQDVLTISTDSIEAVLALGADAAVFARGVVLGGRYDASGFALVTDSDLAGVQVGVELLALLVGLTGGRQFASQVDAHPHITSDLAKFYLVCFHYVRWANRCSVAAA